MSFQWLVEYQIKKTSLRGLFEKKKYLAVWSKEFTYLTVGLKLFPFKVVSLGQHTSPSVPSTFGSVARGLNYEWSTVEQSRPSCHLMTQIGTRS